MLKEIKFQLSDWLCLFVLILCFSVSIWFLSVTVLLFRCSTNRTVPVVSPLNATLMCYIEYKPISYLLFLSFFVSLAGLERPALTNAMRAVIATRPNPATPICHTQGYFANNSTPKATPYLIISTHQSTVSSLKIKMLLLKYLKEFWSNNYK